MNVRDALNIAQEKGLDLIEVAPTAQPPVCRIMDYGKYKYEQGKREREQHKKSKHQDVKGIKMGPVTAEHDFQVRVRHAQEFLKEGDKVKVTIQFKGRQITHPELARRLMERMVEATADISIVEKPAMIEGRMMTLILTPKPEGHKDSKPAQPKTQPAPAAAAPTTSEPPKAPRPAAAPRPAPPAQPEQPGQA